MVENKSLKIETENYGKYSFLSISIILILSGIMAVGFYIADVIGITENSKTHWLIYTFFCIAIPISSIILIYLSWEVYKQITLSIYRTETIIFFKDSILIEYDYLTNKKQIYIDLKLASKFKIATSHIEQFNKEKYNKFSKNLGVHSYGNIEIISDNKQYYLGKNLRTHHLNRIIEFYYNNQI